MWVGILGSVWNPELSAIVPESPWNNAIRASANDRDLWKEELKNKASDFREVRRSWTRHLREKVGRTGRDRRVAESAGEGGAHQQRSADGRHRTTATGTQICFLCNHSPAGCEAECETTRAHVCELCLEPHRSIECPQHQGGDQGKGKHGQEVMCGFFGAPGKGAMKREQVKTRPKTKRVSRETRLGEDSSVLNSGGVSSDSQGEGETPSSLSMEMR